MMYQNLKAKFWRTYADSGFITAPLILILMLLMATMIVIMINTRAVRLKILAVQDSLAAATLAGAIPSEQEFQMGNGVYIPRDKVDDSYDAFIESMKTNLSLSLVAGTTDTFIPSDSTNASMKSIQVLNYQVYSVTANKESTNQIKDALKAGGTTTIPLQYLDITEYIYTPSAHGQANAIQSERVYQKAIVYDPVNQTFISAIPLGYSEKVVSPNGKDIVQTAIYANVKPKFESSIKAMNSMMIDNEVSKVSGIVENYTTQLVVFQGTPNLETNSIVSKEVMGNYYFKSTSKSSVEVSADGTGVIYLPMAASGTTHDDAIKKIAEVMQGAWTGRDKTAVVNGYKIEYNAADDSATSIAQLENCKFGFNLTVNQVYNAIKKGARNIELNVKWKGEKTPISETPGICTIVWYNDGGTSVVVQTVTTPGFIEPAAGKLTENSVDGKNFFAWSTSADISQTTSYKSFLRQYRFEVTSNDISSGKIITLYSLYK